MSSIQRTQLQAIFFSLLLGTSIAAQAEDTPAPAAEPAQVPAPVERQVLGERSESEAKALARQLPTSEQQMLQAGGDEFLALWKPANNPDPQGVVIIVPGAGETADWPTAVAPLRNKLPDAAWGTLSLTLPDLLSDASQPRAPDPTPAPPKAQSSQTPPDANAPIEQAAGGEASEAAAQNNTAEKPFDTDAERIFARLDAAIAFAQQQKARDIVLLGHGTGGYWAARYLSERQPSRAQRLLMVAGKTPEQAPEGLDQLAPALKIPVGDLYYATRPALRDAAKARVQASKRVAGSQYAQVELTALPGDKAAQQEQLYRRVRGWLSPEQNLDKPDF